MDPEIIAGMVFSIVVLLMVGSFVLLYPLSRQLAHLVRRRLNEADPADSISRGDAEKLATAIQQLALGMEALNERQDFVERLLEERPRPSIEGSTDPS